MESATMFLSTPQAAERLGISPRTLEQYRRTGEGPVFHRFGYLVRYLAANIDAWAAARRRITTADDGNAQWERARSHGRRPPRRVTGERNAPRGRGVSSDIETAGSDDIELQTFAVYFMCPGWNGTAPGRLRFQCRLPLQFRCRLTNSAR